MKIATTSRVAFVFILFILNTQIVFPQSNTCPNDDKICQFGFCDIKGCLKCDRYNAICTSSNPNEVIPRQLNTGTRYMVITYTGPPVQIGSSVFTRFHDLNELTMIGRNITALSPRTFLNQPHLNSVNFTQTFISQLPSDLFASKNQIIFLNFPHGKFRHFPVNIFPNIPKVKGMEFSYNPLENCQYNKMSIEKEFQNLTTLHSLRINGFGTSHEDCQDISSDYLQPLSHVRNIYLSESKIFSAGPNILSPLKSLQSLVIDRLPLFKNCPSQASQLFESLPQSLKNLNMRYWTTSNSANKSCFLNHSSLLGLKMLPELSSLDTRYGDKIFGNTLTPDIFDGFHKLKTLYIAWCGISWIRDGTFDSLPQLTDLDLNGNLLGPRKLLLFDKIKSQVKLMNLIDIGITSEVPYDLTNLITSFPQLKCLYLDCNFLQSIPNFLNETYSSNSYYFYHLYVMQVSKNLISTFTYIESQKLCGVMPHLTQLVFDKNKLTDVTGVNVCKTLQHLSLASQIKREF